MARKWYKVGAAAVVAAGISGLAIAGAANASTPAVKLRVCNQASEDQTVEVSGTNQNGAQVTTSFWSVIPASHKKSTWFTTTVFPVPGCEVISDQTDWWWATGQNVTVTHNGVNSHFSIPSDAQDGSTRTATITLTGP